MVARIFKLSMAVVISTLISACSNSDPGALEGTWQSTEMPMTTTFRSGESETLGLIEKVSYEPKGQDVIVHYENGLAKGTALRFTVIDKNTIRNEMGTFRRLR